MKTLLVIAIVLLTLGSNVSAASYGYNITVVIDGNEKDPSPFGVIYVSFAGQKFTEEKKLTPTSERLGPAIRPFFIGSNHPVEDVKYILFKWTSPGNADDTINVSRVIVEPTYLFPYTKNQENRKEFCRPDQFSSVKTDYPMYFSPCQDDNKTVTIEKNIGMPQAMQDYAIKVTLEAMETYKRDVLGLEHIQKAFETKYGNFWLCITGKKWAFFHKIYYNQYYIRFLVGDERVILFRSYFKS